MVQGCEIGPACGSGDSEGFKWGSDAVKGITGSQSTLATAGRRR